MTSTTYRIRFTHPNACFHNKMLATYLHGFDSMLYRFVSEMDPTSIAILMKNIHRNHLYR